MITIATLFLYLLGCIFGSLWIMPPVPASRYQASIEILVVVIWPLSLTLWALINFARWLSGEGEW